MLWRLGRPVGDFLPARRTASRVGERQCVWWDVGKAAGGVASPGRRLCRVWCSSKTVGLTPYSERERHWPRAQASRWFSGKMWRTTNSPSGRHVLGTGRWCDQRTCLRSRKKQCAPPRPRQKVQSRMMLGPFLFSTATAEWAGSRKKTPVGPIVFPGRAGRPPSRTEAWDEGEGSASPVPSPLVRQPDDCCPRKRHVWGTKAKPLASQRLTALLSLNFSLFVLAITSRNIELRSHRTASDIRGRW